MNLVRKEDLEMIIRRINYRRCEKKIFLIAGANGFLASYMVDTLMYLNEHYLSNKCTVIALCRNQKKAEKRFGEWLSKKDFILLIQNVEEPILDSLHIDYVIHAASCAATGSFSSNPVDILSSNIVGTKNLLDISKKCGIEGFLFFSSGAVYGEIGNVSCEIRENDLYPLDFRAPENCYAEGKRCGEALCGAYFEQYKVPVKTVRIGHTYGPGIDLNDGHVYSDFVSKVINRQTIVVRNGNVIRPFCYIVDAVVAFFLILLEGMPGEVYNMVNEEETLSIYELAMKLVREAFPERGLSVVCQNMEQINRITVNTDKLKGLGWHSRIGVVEGFRRTVRSFEEEGI